MPPVIGLTGGYASGKSMALSFFRRMGAHVIDCDLIARQVVEKGSQGLARVREAFGEMALTKDGTLDRGRIAQLVFSDEASRKKLEGILHPLITDRVFREVESVMEENENQVVVVDTPLLFETGLDKRMDKTVVVVCGEEEQVRRGMARDGLTREEALARIRAQSPLEEKAQKADWVIDNSGSQDQARQDSLKIWARIEKL
ncbi:MAG: dephospho-CoA kinase [Nitrospinota bacterium]|nr:dephospho-CoA kinase [Nitrospinota bacterium]